jgi:diaminohydroxyphosphoribosylaminopyrimidine deaminase / 5-amino-6-(5-phosphoribosylamino)uracil reductase
MTDEAADLATDRAFMTSALRMARRGLGTTAPNPSVGAVIVDPASGVVLARGHTQPGGRPHAETHALARIGGKAPGATLYVTLEPCSHTGRTGPCADAVIAAGIARVVVGIEDPDVRVSGAGIARMRAAGVRVDVGCLRDACRQVALGHIRRVTASRPFVQVKVAVGADGLVPVAAGGRPTWITGPEARARGHLMRASADAILVGIGTALADNPGLDCRLPGLAGRSPLRIVLDSDLRLPPDSRLWRSAGGDRQGPAASQLMIFASADAARRHPEFAPGGRIEVVGVSRNPAGGLDLMQVLHVLAGRGITRLLVEGGPTVAGAFVAAGLADECVIFRAGTPVGATGKAAFGVRSVATVTAAGGWSLAGRRRLGPDSVETYVPQGAKPMFTGLVSDIGVVVSRDISAQGARFAIRTAYDAASIKLGASICCDGCCLTATVVETTEQGTVFGVDVSNESLSKTTIGTWLPGTRINLERSLRAGDELGGHMVSGHVDGVAEIVAVRDDGGSRRYTFRVPASIAGYIASKGSVALDGTSLTVNEVGGNEVEGYRFGVNLIPHTLQVTTWGQKRQGQAVNIEIDVFARYVARLMEFRRGPAT